MTKSLRVHVSVLTAGKHDSLIFWRRQGSWWSPRSSKPTRPSSLVWRVRFPSASANLLPIHECVWKGRAVSTDPRRAIPSTDRLLALDQVVDASQRLAPHVIRRIIIEAQDAARRGDITPESVSEQVVTAVEEAQPTQLSSVLNATGVIIHTNLGRAPLSEAARDALVTAAGYVDLELDLTDGKRSKRGTWAKTAVLANAPEAEDVLIVNNGAAALALATTALSVARGTPEIVMSRDRKSVRVGKEWRSR